MKYAIISDVHANLQALQAVLTRAKELGYDRLVCLGDVLGYGANPVECWQLLRQEAQILVMGNHDEAVVNGLRRGFNQWAAAAVLWTQKRLEARLEIPEDIQRWPYMVTVRGIMFVHGSPFYPEMFDYVIDDDSVSAAMSVMTDETALCFIGHTHIPGVFWFDTKTHGGGREVLNGSKNQLIHLSLNRYYLCNVGSVGQPRDGNQNASFAMLDTKTRTLSCYRVAYDIIAAQQALLGSSQPHEVAKHMADRLATGW